MVVLLVGKKANGYDMRLHLDRDQRLYLLSTCR